MLTLPSGWQTKLESTVCYPLMVFELIPNGKNATQILTDGAFENWTTDTDLQDWTETTTGGSVNKESSGVHGGSFCLRIDKTSAAQVAVYNTTPGAWNVTPSKWYQLTGYAKCSSATPDGDSWVRVQNTTAAKFLQADGSWDTPTVNFEIPAQG